MVYYAQCPENATQTTQGVVLVRMIPTLTPPRLAVVPAVQQTHLTPGPIGAKDPEDPDPEVDPEVDPTNPSLTNELDIQLHQVVVHQAVHQVPVNQALHQTICL